ncbi:hypothetical protein [Thalassotalea sp. ND16A]|uniref:hypothetical protein n=1 Tax=Thalassotalea sp. ND16A TaxID=1535422 RepID=UPI00051DA94E|nr:hypothetical protein [Thalassotalea sp. ND16A]KGJ94192.1 hypothetical protein ND16A_1448 [Thalassotalea sp. ND16A]
MTAFKENGFIKVSGHMKPSKSFAARKGHIDVKVFTQEGNLFLSTTAPLGQRVMRKGGDYFSIELTEELPKGAVVKVAFHNANSRDYKENHSQ